MVVWLKTLTNHTYSTIGMNQPMDANYKGQKGVFPHQLQKNDAEGNNKSRNNKYQGKRRPWESGPRGGGRGGSTRGGSDRGGY